MPMIEKPGVIASGFFINHLTTSRLQIADFFTLKAKGSILSFSQNVTCIS